MSLFLPEELNLSDFVYKDYHKNINNDVFLNILKLRINQFNDYEKRMEKLLTKNIMKKYLDLIKIYLERNFIYIL